MDGELLVVLRINQFLLEPDAKNLQYPCPRERLAKTYPLPFWSSLSQPEKLIGRISFNSVIPANAMWSSTPSNRKEPPFLPGLHGLLNPVSVPFKSLPEES